MENEIKFLSTSLERYKYSKEEQALLDWYDSLEIGSLWILPKGTYFFSISLRLNICCDSDLIVKLTNKIYQSGFGEPHTNIFGTIQDEHVVWWMQPESSTDNVKVPNKYTDQRNGEISTNLKNLLKYN